MHGYYYSSYYSVRAIVLYPLCLLILIVFLFISLTTWYSKYMDFNVVLSSECRILERSLF
jgi:hypothetical protein